MKRNATRRPKSRLIPMMLAAGVALTALPAEAQMVCGTRDKIINHLQKKYGETRRSVGLAQGHGIFEVYASEESGSWTIVLTQPNGKTCLMAAGEAFQAVAPEPVKTPT